MLTPERRLFPVLLGIFLAYSIHHGLPQAEAGLLRGKAVYREERVAGARVTATSHMGVPGREKHFNAETGGDGLFQMDLPPGNYHVSYRRGDDLYGFFGGNPVGVTRDRVSEVILRGVAVSGGTVFRDSDRTSMEGKAHLEGKPLAGAVVQVFLDASGRLRGPSFAVAVTDDQGRFVMDLSPGRYFVVARRRKDAGRVGPLRIGDHYAYYPGNPIYLSGGQAAVIDLPFLSVSRDPSEALVEATVGTLVSGSVVDGNGDPVQGVFACLYGTSEPLGKPSFVSEHTDSAGAFSMQVTEAGEYYLVARKEIGRPLEPGEYMAFYQGPRGHLLAVDSGKDRSGLVIVW